MTLPAAIHSAIKRLRRRNVWSSYEGLKALAGRFQAPEPEMRTFNQGHVEMLMWWWERRER